MALFHPSVLLSASFIDIIQRKAIKLMKGLEGLIYRRYDSNTQRNESREGTRLGWRAPSPNTTDGCRKDETTAK